MARHPQDASAVTPPDRPLVAVTATVRADDGVARVRLARAYLDVLARAGLTPIVLAPVTGSDALTAAAVARVLDAVSGLVLTGGEDVDPALYGAVPSPRLGRVNRERDLTELAAVRAAQERRLPTLAICRGVQVLNVALGGTLVQDLPSERGGPLNHDPDAPRTARTHVVRFTPGSRLAGVLDLAELDVNSVHHQAADRVADGLVVTATAPDDVVEGLETPPGDPWWAVGVQWHPEEFVGDADAPDHRLFRAFAASLAGLIPVP